MSSDYLAQIVVNYLWLFSCQKIAVLAVQFRWLQIYFFPWWRSTIKVKAEGKKKVQFICLFFSNFLAFIWLLGRCECYLENWTPPIVWEHKISPAFAPVMPVDVSCFSCGEGIAGSHCFWSLRTSGVCSFHSKAHHELMYDPQSAWNADYFGLKCPIFDSFPSLRCRLLPCRVRVPGVHSELRSSAACPGEAASKCSSSQQAAVSLQEKTAKDGCI